ncbi:hypothetical protein BH10CYA1_BH10CYA1_49020 [soil metagenome]
MLYSLTMFSKLCQPSQTTMRKVTDPTRCWNTDGAYKSVDTVILNTKLDSTKER